MRLSTDDGGGPRRPIAGSAAGWPVWLAGGAGLLLALLASAEPQVAGAKDGLPPVVLSTTRSPLPHVPSRTQAQPPDTVFRHSDHESVDCLSCHTVAPVHGAARVRTLSDCRSCHHRPPLAADCARCHAAADVPQATYALPRAPELSVGVAPMRSLLFRHDDHADVTCASCHAEGPALSAARANCASCHQEHHAPEARCASCHLPALDTVPHTLEVHAGCGGTGCHTELPFEGIPNTRSFCVTCHQEREEHRTGQPCTNCHLLPRPGEAPGPGVTIGAAYLPARPNPWAEG